MQATLNSLNRQNDRISFALPIRIEIKESKDETWSEITRLKDVSSFGAGFNLKRELNHGRLVFLTLPMPSKLRCYDHFASQYQVWSVVRHVVFNQQDETFSIGTAFIGKRPPISYLDNPKTLYQLADRDEKGLWHLTESSAKSSFSPDAVEDKRHLTRHKIPLNIVIQKSDENGNIYTGEASVTEDISENGACVFTTLDTSVGEFVRFTCDQYNVSILSLIRGKHVGQDGISRIHLQFIDQNFPFQSFK